MSKDRIDAELISRLANPNDNEAYDIFGAALRKTFSNVLMLTYPEKNGSGSLEAIGYDSATIAESHDSFLVSMDIVHDYYCNVLLHDNTRRGKNLAVIVKNSRGSSEKFVKILRGAIQTYIRNRHRGFLTGSDRKEPDSAIHASLYGEYLLKKSVYDTLVKSPAIFKEISQEPDEPSGTKNVKSRRGRMAKSTWALPDTPLNANKIDLGDLREIVKKIEIPAIAPRKMRREQSGGKPGEYGKEELSDYLKKILHEAAAPVRIDHLRRLVCETLHPRSKSVSLQTAPASASSLDPDQVSDRAGLDEISTRRSQTEAIDFSESFKAAQQIFNRLSAPLRDCYAEHYPNFLGPKSDLRKLREVIADSLQALRLDTDTMMQAFEQLLYLIKTEKVDQKSPSIESDGEEL